MIQPYKIIIMLFFIYKSLWLEIRSQFFLRLIAKKDEQRVCCLQFHAEIKVKKYHSGVVSSGRHKENRMNA